MHQRVGGHGNIVRLPDRTQIADLLCRYSESLLSPCPSSRTLVDYHEDQEQLTSAERKVVCSHLGICLDCRDKLRWLNESEASSYPVPLNRVIWYVLSVRHPTGVQVARHTSPASGSTAIPPSSSPQPVHPSPSMPATIKQSTVPYIVSGDGALFGEFRQDRRHRMYLKMLRLPRSFQWHALHIRVLTFDRRVLVSSTRTISGPKFHLNHPPRVTPGDLDRVELGLIPLR